jgi:hypothetical protein
MEYVDCEGMFYHLTSGEMMQVLGKGKGKGKVKVVPVLS